MANDSLSRLADVIRQGLAREGGAAPSRSARWRAIPEAPLGPSLIRGAYALASAEEQDGVPFAGLIHRLHGVGPHPHA